MIDSNFYAIKSYISGERALQNVRVIANFHRIQASPGYREAAVFCAKELKKQGIQCRIISYPADGIAHYWTQKMFKEWSCDEAYLDLLGGDGQRLCDFSSEAHSLIQRSMSLDFTKEPLELMVMDKGPDPTLYTDAQLRGKLLLINDDPAAYLDWAVGKCGAVGFVSDRVTPIEGVRERGDLYDTRMYQSFWYNGGRSEVLSAGFVITPRQGDMLRALAAKAIKENDADHSKPRFLKLSGKISSRLYIGEIEVAEAFIPGSSCEEVIVSAHLCHPRSSANDNASGVAGGMELMVTLNNLIKSGVLPVPKRGIRLILIPEMTGTYAYLSSREKNLSKIMAGINLDMIGASQDGNIAPITLTGLPNAMPSFVHDVSAYLLDLLKKEAKSFSGGDIAMFMWELSEYSGGSDHYIMSDPTVGIPCIMLGQWPDKYYHSSGDTTDKIDPAILKRSTTIAAAYAYSLANLSLECIPVFMNKTRESFSQKVSMIISKAIVSSEPYQLTAQRIQHACEVVCCATDDYKRFFVGEELATVKRIVADERRYLIRSAKEMSERHQRLCQNKAPQPCTEYGEEYEAVPTRIFPGPLRMDRLFADSPSDLLNDYNRLSKSFKEMGMALDIALFWANSKRCVGEIARKVFLDTGYDNAEAILELFKFLGTAGYVMLK